MPEEFYEQLGPKTPKIMEHYSKRLLKEEDINLEESKYEDLFEKYEEEFSKAVDELLRLWNSKEHREVLGHDNIHISYDLLEFLYSADNVKLTKNKKYLILFGSLLHDLGRYPELLLKERSGAMDFEKSNEIQLHAALSGYLGAILARKFKSENENDPDIIEASKSFNRRVIGAALFHGGKNEKRDPIVHHIQSNDRLAGILGSREFVRNVVTDGVQRGALVYPNEKLSYDRTFPLFNNLPPENYKDAEDPKKSWTNIVHYLEMPMRNMYPLSSESGMERAKNMKRESGIILTFLSGGKDTKLYNEIFAPEINPDQDFSFPKNKLPDDVWEKINQGTNEEELKKMQEYEKLDIIDLVNLMLDQQASDIPPAEREKVHQLLANVPENHKEHIRSAIEYVVARRELNKVIERKFIDERAMSSDPLIAKIAEKLKESKLFS